MTTVTQPDASTIRSQHGDAGKTLPKFDEKVTLRVWISDLLVGFDRYSTECDIALRYAPASKRPDPREVARRLKEYVTDLAWALSKSEKLKDPTIIALRLAAYDKLTSRYYDLVKLKGKGGFVDKDLATMRDGINKLAPASVVAAGRASGTHEALIKTGHVAFEPRGCPTTATQHVVTAQPNKAVAPIDEKSAEHAGAGIKKLVRTTMTKARAIVHANMDKARIAFTKIYTKAAEILKRKPAGTADRHRPGQPGQVVSNSADCPAQRVKNVFPIAHKLK